MGLLPLSPPGGTELRREGLIGRRCSTALAELFVARHPVEEAIFFPFAVDGVAVVVQTIGDEQAAGLDDAVVDGDLVEGLLADGDIGLLALGHQHRPTLGVVDDDVGAKGLAVQVDPLFDGGQSTRIAQL